MPCKLSHHSVRVFIQRLLTDSLLKLLEGDEAPLLAVEDGVAHLHHAVPLGDPLQVGRRDVFEGADDRPGDVSETVPEVSLVEERDGAGVLLVAGLGPPVGLVVVVLLVVLGVRGDAGDLVAVDCGVWTVDCVGVVPARLAVKYLYL